MKEHGLPRVLLPALVLTLSAANQAQQSSDNGSTSAPGASPAPTNIALALRPTDHPRVPRDLSQLWMAPEKGRVRSAAQANLATAIKIEAEGNHAKALALLTNPATAQQGPLASYVAYYKGLALLRLGRNTEARATFQALQSPALTGFLVEGAALREAESDEALGDYVAAVSV